MSFFLDCLVNVCISSKEEFMYKALALALLVLIFIPMANAHDWDSARPDSHAPIGVMGDHTHKAGEWMASYRFRRMRGSGLRSSFSDSVSPSSVLSSYMVAPEKMTRDVNMLGFMYAPIDQATFTFMVPYIDQSMEGRNRMMQETSSASSGVGDLKLASIVPLSEWMGQRVLFNLGVSFPTGSIDERVKTAMGEVRMPYSMQLGSGTYDILPGLTYVGQSGAWSWGAQAKGVVRIGENDNDYSLGDIFSATAWTAIKTCGWWSNSLRFIYSDMGSISGVDPDLNPMMSPAAKSLHF
jgi:hypothetical protein